MARTASGRRRRPHREVCPQRGRHHLTGYAPTESERRSYFNRPAERPPEVHRDGELPVQETEVARQDRLAEAQEPRIARSNER